MFEIAGTFNSVTCNQIHRLYFTCISILQHVLWITMIFWWFFKKTTHIFKRHFSIQKYCTPKVANLCPGCSDIIPKAPNNSKCYGFLAKLGTLLSINNKGNFFHKTHFHKGSQWRPRSQSYFSNWSGTCWSTLLLLYTAFPVFRTQNTVVFYVHTYNLNSVYIISEIRKLFKKVNGY